MMCIDWQAVSAVATFFLAIVAILQTHKANKTAADAHELSNDVQVSRGGCVVYG